MSKKTLENAFFFTEVAFLLTTCAMALYNIYFDKNMYVLLAILAGYILTIKALRRVFTNPEGLKEKKSKYLTLFYLTASSYLFIHISITMIT